MYLQGNSVTWVLRKDWENYDVLASNARSLLRRLSGEIVTTGESMWWCESYVVDRNSIATPIWTCFNQ